MPEKRWRNREAEVLRGRDADDAVDPDGPTMDDMHGRIMEAFWRRAETGEVPDEATLTEFYDAARRTSALRVDPPQTGPVVYYFRVGNRIKIGWTNNLEVRIRNLMPEEVLGWEYGDRDLERKRHKRFAHYRTSREWFEDKPAIRAHIATLQSSRATG